MHKSESIVLFTYAPGVRRRQPSGKSDHPHLPHRWFSSRFPLFSESESPIRNKPCSMLEDAGLQQLFKHRLSDVLFLSWKRGQYLLELAGIEPALRDATAAHSPLCDSPDGKMQFTRRHEQFKNNLAAASLLQGRSDLRLVGLYQAAGPGYGFQSGEGLDPARGQRRRLRLTAITP